MRRTIVIITAEAEGNKSCSSLAAFMEGLLSPYIEQTVHPSIAPDNVGTNFHKHGSKPQYRKIHSGTQLSITEDVTQFHSEGRRGLRAPRWKWRRGEEEEEEGGGEEDGEEGGGGW